MQTSGYERSDCGSLDAQRCVSRRDEPAFCFECVAVSPRVPATLDDQPLTAKRRRGDRQPRPLRPDAPALLSNEFLQAD